MDTARDNPLATVAVVGGAVAAGIFLWSRRDQISDQIEYLAYQLSEWREGLESDGEANADRMTSETSSGARTQAEISEEALTLKEIGDHLGHRSTSATSTYAKVNMAALREVGAFDVGDVL